MCFKFYVSTIYFSWCVLDILKIMLNFKLKYDYERDDNFDWDKLKSSDTICYYYSKCEELEQNIIFYSKDYTPRQVGLLKNLSKHYFKKAERLERTDN